MKQREKMLVLIVGGLVVIFVGFIGLRSAFLAPLRSIDKNTAALREKLDKIKAERRAFFAAEDRVKGFTQRTFADQIDQASAKSGEMLTKQIAQAGLREADFSRSPFGPVKLPRANEIGWSVQGQGKMASVVNLLFLLQESPYLHRIEHLSVSAGDSPGYVRVGFRFLTLVLDSAPVVDPIPLETKFTLESPERKTFDGIVARDLLRPYVKRSPDKGPGPSESPSVPSGPGSLRVVSLSEWMGEPEVHVRDLTNQKTQRYKPGDELAGGKILMVDYRPLPLPGHEGLKSYSRVILKIGDEYWAVERGQTLAEKYRLPADLLPDGISKL